MYWTPMQEKNCLEVTRMSNGTACFKKCKQLFEYQHLLLLRHLVMSSKLYLNVNFFNASVNKTSVAAYDSCFLHWCLIHGVLLTLML
jgi:hypothetical protein